MNARVGTQETAPVSLGDWILTLIVLAIPIVGLVMLFVWGFGSGTHPSKQNFCRASLILYLIGIVIFVLFMMTFGFAAFSMMHGMGGASL
ncbi:MAG: hypothetical protein ACREPU_12725 [Rhodanobacteraceae bacterium]